MIHVSIKSLAGKLNATCRRSLEGAAGLCLSRSNYNVEIEHWLLKLMEPANTDIARILRHYDVDTARLTRDLTRALDQLRTGNARAPELSEELVTWMRETWALASLEYAALRIRSGFLLTALLGDRLLARRAQTASAELVKIPAEALQKDVRSLIAGSAEDAAEPGEAPPPETPAAGKPAAGSRTPALDQFTQDLTALARQGKLDPVTGRDFEIRQVVDILTRRRQNNPILTGEAGVGKTAVVEGFALRVAAGDVPPALKNVAIRTLDLVLLQAGAGIKGEFENRLRSVIEEVKASPQPIILFIDEAHTMIGAGGQAGQGDAANLLKPALARGELRTIAATTWAEYKKYFEKDAALTRRFQVVKVEEPSEAATIAMLNSMLGYLEKHHHVRILDEAIRDAVKLSHRYLSSRQLPEKAVSLVDTACARVSMSQKAIPSAVEDARRRIERVTLSMNLLEREAATGTDHHERLTELAQEKDEAEKELAIREAQWKSELELVAAIHKVRDQLDPPSPASPPASGEAPVSPLASEEQTGLRAELAQLQQQLRTIQGENPLLHVWVDSQAIAAVVSAWTGIPVGRMVSDEIQAVMSLQERLRERIIGQAHALDSIAQRIRTARANLTDPRRPIGVFLLVGTSGVGKTETALTLADILYGGEQNLTVINMSEFKEEHKVSLLMGSPPGYIGYGEGGVLTEAVRRRPYSVLLLDEMEKAHPGVQDIFYQVFDKGSMRDGEGRDIDFKNTLILMTSNCGTDTIQKVCADPETMPDAEGLSEALRPELLKVFKPAFLGRLIVVPYFPLSDAVMRSIIELQLGRIGKRIAENYKARFSYAPEVVAHIGSRCKEVESGARNVDHILTRTLLPELAVEFLDRMARGQSIAAVHVSTNVAGGFHYEIT
jgi:type VI secretion system protein VasG